MEYNKQQFQKTNDKKILHKVKKHWVVMSMALLMAIGGKVAITHVSANADSNNNQTDQTDNVDTVKNNLNQQLVKSASSNTANNTAVNTNNANNNQNQSAQSNLQGQPTLSECEKQATALHQQIIRNAGFVSASNSVNGRQSNSDESATTPQTATDQKRLLGGIVDSSTTPQVPKNTQDITVNYTFGGKLIPGISGTKALTVNNNLVDKNSVVIPSDSGYQVAWSDQKNAYSVFNDTKNHTKAITVPVDIYSRWGGYTEEGGNDPKKMAPWYLDPQGRLMIGSGNLSLGTDSWDGTPSDRNTVKEIKIFPGDHVSAKGISSDFANFPNVQTIDVTGLDTTNTSDFNNAFANDPKLTEINGLGPGSNGYKGLNITNKAESMNGVFASDDSLTTVDLPDMSAATQISDFGAMFKNDPKLQTINNLTTINTSNASDLAEMFENDDMSTLDLSGFDTRKAQNMSDFIGSDAQLTTISVGSDTRFYNPSAHHMVDNGNADIANWTPEPYAGPGFTGAWQNRDNDKAPVYNSSDLNSAAKIMPKGTYIKNVVPAYFKYQKWFSNKQVNPIQGQIGYLSPGFTVASDASQIPDISNYEKGNISDNGHPAYDIHKYQVADNGDDNGGNYLPKEVVSHRFNQSYVIPVVSSKVIGYGYDGTAKYELNNRGSLKISSGQLAQPLYECFNPASDNKEARSVRTISFASTTQAPKDASNLFANLPNVESIDLHGLDTTGTTNMAGMFHANDSRTLQTITGLQGLNTSSVSDMQGMFKDTGLRDKDISDIANWNVANVTNLNSDFQGDINLNSWTPSKLYNNWTFNAQPTVVNMLNQTSLNNGDDPTVSKHVLENNKWKFTPSIVQKQFKYVDWITGKQIGDVTTANVFPGVQIRSDANEIPPVNGYQIADNGDDVSSDTGSTNYIPNSGTSDYVDGGMSTYTIPVIPDGITHYGYSGTSTNDAKYELDNNGVLTFYKGDGQGLVDKPVKDFGSFASDVKTIQFKQPNQGQSDVSLASDAKAMFSSLPNLSQFDQNNLNVANSYNTSDLFSNDPSLVTLDLSALNFGSFASSQNFNNMFANDPNLRYANLYSLNTNSGSAVNIFGNDFAVQALTLGSTPISDPTTSSNVPAFFKCNVFSNGQKGDITAGNLDPGTYYAASPVAIHFVDQNGTSKNSGRYIYVPTHMDSYQYGTGYKGTVESQLSDLENQEMLVSPAGYTLVSLKSPQQDPSIHGGLDNNPYVNVKVIGNNDNSEIDHGYVQMVYENHDGSTTGQINNGTPVKLPITLSGHNSDVMNLDPNNWVPKGYYLDVNTQKPAQSKTHPSDFVAKIQANGQLQWVHVTDQTAHTVQPDASSYLPTFYVRAETATANPNSSQHQISDPTVTVNQILEASDGHVVGYNTEQVPVTGDVGSTYTLNNNSDRMQTLGSTNSDHYTLDTNTNSPMHGKYNKDNGNVSGKIMVNAAGHAYLTNPIEDLYYVKKIDTKITVHYINQAGQEVDSFTSNPESDGTVLNLKSNSPFITDSAHQVPGYTYDNSNKNNISGVTFGDHDQNAYVYVIGNPKTLNVQYVYNYQNNNKNYTKKLASDNIQTNVGSEVKVPTNVSSIPSDVYMLADNQNNVYLKIPNSKLATYYVNYVGRQLTVPVQFMHNGQPYDPVDYSTHGVAYNTVTLPQAPEGYHYDKANDQKYQIVPTPSDHPTNLNHNGQLQTDNVKVDSDLAKVHVQYYDQNDKLLKQSDTSGNDHVGHTITFTAPKGYHFKNDATTYTFKPQDAIIPNHQINTVNVYVVGNNVKSITAPVYVQYENYDGSNRGARQSATVKMNFSNQINNQYTFHPTGSDVIDTTSHQNMVPDGYQIDYTSQTNPNKTNYNDNATVNSDGMTWSDGQPTVYIKADQSITNADYDYDLHVTQIEETPSGQIVGINQVSPHALPHYSVGDIYKASVTSDWLNLPNYQLASGTEPNSAVNNSKLSNGDLTGKVTASGLTNNHVSLYYVADKANDLTVDYKIHGMDGSSDTAIPQANGGSYVYSGGYYGESVNGFDHIPSGYHLDTSNTPLNTTFTLGDQQPAKTVYVLPDAVNKRTVPVEAVLEDPNGNQIYKADGSKANVPVNITVNVNTRGQFKITPSDQAFQIAPLVNANNSDGFVPYKDSDISGYMTPMGPKITSPNKGTFIFRAKNDAQTTGSINVQFINQNGQLVNKSTSPSTAALDGTIATDPSQYTGYTVPNGYYDETIDVTKLPGIPKGYHFATGQSDQQPRYYTFNGQHQTAMVRIDGNEVKDPMNVKIVKEDPYFHNLQSDVLPKPNPTQKASSDVFYVSGQVGDTFNYSNSDFKPASYLYDPASAYSDASVTILPNGKLEVNNDPSDQNSMGFRYYLNAATNNLANITIDYESTEYTTDNNGHKSHSIIQKVINPNSDITGPYAGKIIPDVTHVSSAINTSQPKGYRLVPGQNLQATIGTAPSTITLMVQPTTSTGQGDNNSDDAQPIKVTYLRTDNGQTVGKPFYAEGYMDQTVNVADVSGHEVPQGYHLMLPQKLDYQIGNKLGNTLIFIAPDQNSTQDYYNQINVETPSDQPIRSYQSKVQPVKLNQSITVNPANVSDVTTASDGQHLSGKDYKLVSSGTPFTVTNNGGSLTMSPQVLTYQARADNHGKIIVQYYDDGNNGAQIQNAGNTIDHGYDGEVFTAKQIASDAADHVNVPNGYTLDSDQTQSYVMNNNQTAPVVAKLFVHGNQTVSGTAQITLNEYDPYNNLIASPKVNDVINGTVGDGYRIDPQDYVPTGGYSLDKKYQTENQPHNGVLTPNGISDGSKNLQFYYQLPQSDAQNVQPITVNYVDNGYRVGGGVINATPNVDYAGKEISDVTKYSSTKLPNGYIVDRPFSQKLSTVFSHSPQYMTINVRTSTNKANGNFLIVNNLYNHDHSQLVKTETKLLPLSGVIGTKFNVSPAQFAAPVGYQPVETQPHVAHVTYTPSGLSQSSTSYDYVSDAIQPINVSYVDQGRQVASDSITSEYGKPLTMGEEVDTAQNVPAGYQLTSGQDPIKTASQNVQNVALQVEPSTNTTKMFDIKIVRRDPTGSPIPGDSDFVVPVRITAAIGSKQRITTDNLDQMVTSDVKPFLQQQLSGFTPYHHGGSDVNVTNNDSGLTPVSGTFDYVARQDVKPINVVYYNQHGQNVGNGQITTGNPSNPNMPTYVGEVVPDVTARVALPKGYQLMPGLTQNKAYKFSSDSQTANLMVAGMAQSDTVKVNIYKGGKASGFVTAHVHGNVGDTATVDARNFIPKGYVIANNGQQTQVQVAIGDKNVSPTSVNFDYDPDPTNKVQPIYVTYINQAGTPIVKDQKLQGTYGDSVDVYNSTKSDLNDYSDHHALYTLDMADNGSNYQYTYGDNAQYATIMVTGVPVTNHYQVKRTLIRYTAPNQSDNVAGNQSISGRIGDVVTITPDEYVPNGYKADASNQIQSFTLGSDVNQAHPMSFIYDKLPVTNHVIFKDVDTNSQVGEEDMTGLTGSEIYWPDYYDFVPYGYKYAKNGHQNATIQGDDSSNPNVVYVKNLNDKPAPQPAPHAGYGTITIHYVNNSDHSRTIENRVLNQPILNSSFNFLNYTHSDAVPNGYHWTTNDYINTENAMHTIVNQFTAKPQEVTLYVSKDGSISDVSTDSIEYLDTDDHDKQVGRTRVINGNTGSSIDYSPYESNLPTGYSFASLGTHDDVYEPDRTEIVYVHPATNKVQYGEIDVVYEDVTKDNKPLSGDNIQFGISGNFFDEVSDAVDDVPDGYDFDHVSQPVTQFNNGVQKMVIGVKPHRIFSSVTVNYVDRDTSQSLGSEKVTGRIGDPFGLAPYEIDIPSGYQFNGTKGDTFDAFQYDPKSITIYLKKLD